MSLPGCPLRAGGAWHRSCPWEVSETELNPLCVQTSLGEGLITAGAQLVELDLSDNAFGPDGVRGFEALLKSSACFTLHELKLNNCGMGIGGGKVGAAALPRIPIVPTLPPALPGLLLCWSRKDVLLATIWDGWPVVFLFRGERPQRQQPVASGERRWRPGGRGCQATIPSSRVVLATQRQLRIHALTCWLCRALGLGIPDALCPQNSWQSHVRPVWGCGGGSPERETAQAWAQLTFFLDWPCRRCLPHPASQSGQSVQKGVSFLPGTCTEGAQPCLFFFFDPFSLLSAQTPERPIPILPIPTYVLTKRRKGLGHRDLQ